MRRCGEDAVGGTEGAAAGRVGPRHPADLLQPSAGRLPAREPCCAPSIVSARPSTPSWWTRAGASPRLGRSGRICRVGSEACWGWPRARGLPPPTPPSRSSWRSWPGWPLPAWTIEEGLRPRKGELGLDHERRGLLEPGATTSPWCGMASALVKVGPRERGEPRPPGRRSRGRSVVGGGPPTSDVGPGGDDRLGGVAAETEGGGATRPERWLRPAAPALAIALSDHDTSSVRMTRARYTQLSGASTALVSRVSRTHVLVGAG